MLAKGRAPARLLPVIARARMPVKGRALRSPPKLNAIQPVASLKRPRLFSDM
jgi:hypothetical protein